MKFNEQKNKEIHEGDEGWLQTASVDSQTQY
jgi:hypothetical protein